MFAVITLQRSPIAIGRDGADGEKGGGGCRGWGEWPRAVQAQRPAPAAAISSMRMSLRTHTSGAWTK